MINNNINLLVEPPPYNSENIEDENDDINLENENDDINLENENDDIELPPYEDNNNESEFFLNNRSTNIVLKKKIVNFILTFIFLIIYITFFFLITKPFVINSCRDPIITINSTCHHDYICDSNNKCRYIDSCDLFKCLSLFSWLYYLIIITCIPSLIILQFLVSIFNLITRNKYIKYIK